MCLIDARLTIAVFTQHGKSLHATRLKFFDGNTYALAQSLNLPLIFKGNDFAQTDIAPPLA